jgi:hypothetical protein
VKNHRFPKKGTDRLRLDFVLKLDSGVPPVSTIGIAIGSRFRFSVFRYGLGANELESIYYSYGPYCLVSSLEAVEALAIDFPTVQEEIKSCFEMPFLISN